MCVTCIVELFKNTNNLFFSDKQTSQVMVISIYSVITSYYGLNALQKQRKGQLEKGVKLNLKLFKVPNRLQEYDLQYYQYTIILNKAYNVKNSNYLASITIINIDYRFNVLVSVTPLFSSIKDNFSLPKIIQPIFKFNYLVSGLDGINIQ